MTVRFNPYLVLGIDYGASPGEASIAFARAQRRLRSADDPPFTKADINKALHYVQHLAKDPEASIDYFRVPADPRAYLPPSCDGLLDPPEDPPMRHTPMTTEADLKPLRLAAATIVAVEALDDLGSAGLGLL